MGSIPLFYAVGLACRSQSNFAIGDFWRFWVVHLWVEDFLELFTTIMVAFIFVLLGVVSEKTAVGWRGGFPALTVEAWTFLHLGARQEVTSGPGQFPHRWAVLYLVAVGFWNFLGAGVFGFLINLPMVSYYEIGTQLTANHAHAAFAGVYVMLALALLVFALRYLARPEDWNDRMVGFSFWALNLGLAWMVFFNLFPLGVLQLGDSVAHGYWHARSIDFFRGHTFIEWLRLPGDMLFIAGVLPLVYLTARAVCARGSIRRNSVRGQPAVPGSAAHRPGSPGRRDSVNELEKLASPPADLEVWLLLGYAATVLAGARLMEALAQMHFRRARRYAEHGFCYDADADHYHCPQGERLSLHLIDSDERVAVYRAPASTCAECPSKAACTPHDEGRHIYRPLAEWAETDVGQFHRWLSLLMAGSAHGSEPGRHGALGRQARDRPADTCLRGVTRRGVARRMEALCRLRGRIADEIRQDEFANFREF